MENQNSKKPKRPRIGRGIMPEPVSNRNYDRPYTPSPRPQYPSNDDYNQSNYDNDSYAPRENNYSRPYQPRPYNGGQRSEQPYRRQNDYTPNYQRPQVNYDSRRPDDSQPDYRRRPYNPDYQRPQQNYDTRRPYPQNPYGRQEQGRGPRDDRYSRPQNRPNGGNGYQRPMRPEGQGDPNRQRRFVPFYGRGKSFVPRPRRIEYEQPIPDPNEQMRLNKFMSNSGICSRREADEFIQQGLVKVNGKVVTELGTKIGHNDIVEYDEKVVTMQSKCYILLNKPKDCVTTTDDPNGRMTVMDLIKGACPERVYPVGRLDRNTTGVLLLTNDGDLASKLTHPKYVKKKIYHVWTDRDIAEEDMQRLADGIELEDGPIHADAISYANETDRNQAGVEIHSGRNRIVRRMFESLGYHVTKLDRVYFAGLTKKNLPRGRWRYLTQEEVNFLKMGSFE